MAAAPSSPMLFPVCSVCDGVCILVCGVRVFLLICNNNSKQTPIESPYILRNVSDVSVLLCSSVSAMAAAASGAILMSTYV